MPKANALQPSFTAGEISPQMRGRVDTAKYSSGLAEALNVIPKAQGSFTRRPGTKYIATTKDNGYARLVPFKFSNVQAYIIEFGSEYIRFYRNDTLVTGLDATKAVANEIYTGTPTRQRLTFGAAHGYLTNDLIVIKTDAGEILGETYVYDVTDSTHIDLPPFTVEPTVPFVEIGYTTQKVGSSTLEVTTPYLEGHLDQLSFAQSADVLYICHPAYAPRKLSRINSYEWTLSTIEFVDGPFMGIDDSGIKLTISSIVDRATIKAATGTPFIAGDENAGTPRYIEWREHGVFHLGKVIDFVSSTELTIDIIANKVVYLDPRVTLTEKSGNKGDITSTAGATSRQAVQPGKLPYPDKTPWQWRNVYAPTGLAPKYRRDFQPDDEGFDPAVDFNLSGTTLTSENFSHVFNRRMKGKYVRVPKQNPPEWREITAIESDVQVTVAASALTMIDALNGAGETVDNFDPYVVEGSRTITATLTASAPLFSQADIGRLMRLKYGDRWIWLKITSTPLTTTAGVSLYDDFPTDPWNHAKLYNRGVADYWRWGAWSDTTGYPGTCSFHEQRLVFARTNAEPQTLWFSRSGDFENFAPTQPRGRVDDDNGIAFTLVSGEVNAIQWLVSHRVLMVGTVGGEWQVRAATSINNPITPTDISITPETSVGSIDCARAYKISSRILHLSRSGKKLREMKYSFEDDAWISNDLTIASEHILRAGTNGCQVEFQREPIQLVWILLASGDLVSLTYEPEQQVYAFAQHTIGGSANVESFAVIPNSTGSQSDLYIVAERTVNGATKRYIEKMDQEFTSTSTSDMHFLDSYETGTGNTTITGLTRLEGLTVRVVKAGVDVGAYVVSGGQITGVTGGNAAYTVGLNYTSRAVLLPPEGGSGSGTSQGKTKRAHRMDVRCYNSVGFSYAPYVEGTVGTLVERVLNSNALASKDVRIDLSNTYESEQMVAIATEKAYALTVLAAMPVFKTNE